VPVEGIGMDEINLYSVYNLGARLDRLRDLKSSTKVDDVLEDLIWSRVALIRFRSRWFIPLGVCEAASERLLRLISEIAANLKGEQLGEIAPQLYRALDTLETVMANELPKIASYIVPPRGLFSTDRLIRHAESALPDTSRDILSEHVVKDLQEAGRCIAFGVPTAAAFHLWRATECAMHEYYDVVTIGAPRPNKFPTWATYHHELTKANADPRILGVLDQIFQLHRNPTSHPEQFIELDEAISLLGVACDAMRAIADDMRKRIAAALP
jgi:hypothetical protein